MEKVEFKSKEGLVGFSAMQCRKDDIKGNVEMITDWLDGMDEYDIYEVVKELDCFECLNEKGKKLLEELKNRVFKNKSIKNDTKNKP